MSSIRVNWEHRISPTYCGPWLEQHQLEILASNFQTTFLGFWLLHSKQTKEEKNQRIKMLQRSFFVNCKNAKNLDIQFFKFLSQKVIQRSLQWSFLIGFLSRRFDSWRSHQLNRGGMSPSSSSEARASNLTLRTKAQSSSRPGRWKTHARLSFFTATWP